MATNEVTYEVRGCGPMLTHNARLSNPLNDWAREIKKISAKRKKTDDDHIEMARLEFMGGCYWKDGKSFYIPSENWESGIAEAAKKLKMGKAIKSGAQVFEDSILSFDGPKTPDERWNDPSCRDQRPAKVGTSRVMRTRPVFMNWRAKVRVSYDPELIDRAVLDNIMGILGAQVGLGDYRPKFGRFEVVDAK